MNHHRWYAALMGDRIDENLAANADGSIYCIERNGTILW